MSTKQNFDADGFYAALERAVRARGVTWKQVSEATGVGGSTLSRMRDGRRPDAASLAALSGWGGLNPAEFLSFSPAPQIPVKWTEAEIRRIVRDELARPPGSAPFFSAADIAKAVMTPEQEDTVRRGCCPKCMERTLSEPIESGGVAFRQCSRCQSMYALGMPPTDEQAEALRGLRNLKVLLGTDAPEVHGWAPAVQQAAQKAVNAAITALSSAGIAGVTPAASNNEPMPGKQFADMHKMAVTDEWLRGWNTCIAVYFGIHKLPSNGGVPEGGK